MRIIPSKGNSKAILSRIALFLAVYVLFILNWRLDVLRFSLDALNYLFFLLILCIPILLLIVSLRFPKTWVKAVAVLCVLPLLLGSAFLAILTVIVLPNVVTENQPALQRRVRTIQSQYYSLAIYYSDYVVTIKQEKEVFPGVLLVRQVYLTPGTDVALEVLDSDRIKISSTIDPATNGGRILSLKRFVYL
jgi:hypothetical protein